MQNTQLSCLRRSCKLRLPKERHSSANQLLRHDKPRILATIFGAIFQVTWFICGRDSTLQSRLQFPCCASSSYRACSHVTLLHNALTLYSIPQNTTSNTGARKSYWSRPVCTIAVQGKCIVPKIGAKSTGKQVFRLLAEPEWQRAWLRVLGKRKLMIFIMDLGAETARWRKGNGRSVAVAWFCKKTHCWCAAQIQLYSLDPPPEKEV